MAFFNRKNEAKSTIRVGYKGKEAKQGLGGLKTSLKGLDSSLKSSKASLIATGVALAGLTIALIKTKQAISFVADSVIKFEAAGSRLKAILKPTTKEFEALEKQAQKLGETTVFTATQVMQAFTEMGKLGAETNEILAAGNEVLSLAALAQVDMSTAAITTIQTLNQFQLEAEEAGRVVDVIAKSFTTSALDITKFSTAMTYIGPIAGTTGESLEDVSAALAVLADNALDSSMAGTGMRKILLELANANSKASKLIAGTGKEASTLTEKLQLLKTMNLGVTETTELFGLRATTAAQIIIKNADSVETLAEEYNNAEGAAQEMADTMLDNVEGAMIRLKSAQESLALSFKTVLAPAMRTFIELLIDITLGIKDVITQETKLKNISFEKANKEVIELTENINLWKTAIAEGNKELVKSPLTGEEIRTSRAQANLDHLIKKMRELSGEFGELGELDIDVAVTGKKPSPVITPPPTPKIKKDKAPEWHKELLRMREDFAKADRKLQQEDEKGRIKLRQKEFLAERDKELGITEISAEAWSERIQIHKNAQLINGDIDLIAHNEKLALLELQKETYPNLQKEINMLIEQENEKFRQSELEKEQELQMQKIMLASQSVDALATINNALIGLSDARTQQEIRNLEKKGLSEEEFEKQKAKLLEEGEEKRRAFARIQQGIAAGEAIVNTAMAATGAMAQTPGPIWVRTLAAITAATLGAIEVATIEAQHFAMGRIGDKKKSRQSDNILAAVGAGETIVPAAQSATHERELQAIVNNTANTAAGVRGMGRGQTNYNFHAVSDEQILQVISQSERKNASGVKL